ncbi:LicD family protein [Streptococcus hyointestinalis]|uniref:LicD family protein n=1 Tax=Streptococcus hyointestinalis TaxID=1337 RepID=UPI003CFD6696
MSSQIKLIQNKELDILKKFIEVCQEYNLTYYVVGGTLLGAVRHKGFIPWDDDIDVAMPRKDFERLKEIERKAFTYPYRCISEENTPTHTKAFMNIQDKSTKLLMTYSNIKQEASLWIDVFPIDGMPSHPLKRFIHEKKYLLRRMFVQLSQFNTIVNQNKENRPLSERLVIATAKVINFEKLLNYKKMQEKYINTLKKYDMSEDYSGNLTGAYKLKEIVPTKFWGEGSLLDFEDIKVNAPVDYRGYLQAIYGDSYMELPPVEQRVPHQYEIISLGDNHE